MDKGHRIPCQYCIGTAFLPVRAACSESAHDSPDISPIAPVHFLVIPKEHIQSVDAIDEKNSEIVAYIFQKIGQLAKEAGIENGYRVISNCGADAGQTVLHLHFHVIGGKELSWQA